jgi:hypothetical protein
MVWFMKNKGIIIVSTFYPMKREEVLNASKVVPMMVEVMAKGEVVAS